jgi:hypothetical protein
MIVCEEVKGGETEGQIEGKQPLISTSLPRCFCFEALRQ